MLTEAMGGIISTRLGNFFKTNQSQIDRNMVRIASGKRFQGPGIYAADYFRARELKNDVRGIQALDREIVSASGMLKVAEQAGTSVLEDLMRMKEVVKQYYDNRTLDVEKTVLAIEFNNLKNTIGWTISTTKYDGKQLIANNGATPLRRVGLDPRDISQTLDISYNANHVANVGSLTIGDLGSDYATEMAAVETEFDKAASYLAKTAAYNVSLNAFYDMNDKKKINYIDQAGNIENTHDGAEYMALSKRQLAQQMTVSMMAQSNLVRNSVLDLVSALKA